MKTIIKSLILFTISVVLLGALAQCNEEEIVPNEPQCECYEVHEQLETVNSGNGLPTLAWVVQYETTPVTMPCDSETEYTSVNNSQRWKVICQ
jgi:hypothetical protein